MSNEKVYVGDTGTEIVLDCGINISTATVRQILVRRPDGTETTWNASADGTTAIVYTTQAVDLSQPGIWLLQAAITMPGWSGKGATAELMVHRRFG